MLHSTWSIGWRSGVVLAFGAIVFAQLGLRPEFAWIPEVPLIAAGLLIPTVVFAFAGVRAAHLAGRSRQGAIAGAVAGAIGGLTGGLSFVLFGKPLLNIVVGPLVGAAGGALVAAAAVAATRLPRRTG